MGEPVQQQSDLHRVASALEALANAANKIASKMPSQSGEVDRLRPAPAAPEGQGLGAMNDEQEEFPNSCYTDTREHVEGSIYVGRYYGGSRRKPCLRVWCDIEGGNVKLTTSSARALGMRLLAWANEVEADDPS